MFCYKKHLVLLHVCSKLMTTQTKNVYCLDFICKNNLGLIIYAQLSAQTKLVA